MRIGMPTEAALMAAGSIAQMACRVDIGKKTLISADKVPDSGKARINCKGRTGTL